MLIHNKKFKILFSLILLNSSAQGHHSFAVEFTAEEKIAIVGTVTEIWFRNPHVRYYIETKNSSGEMGDKISIFGHPGRDGRKLLSVISIKLPDGSSLGQSYPD